MNDPTTAVVEAQVAERAQLRAEVDRLERALVDAYTDVEGLTAERDRLSAIDDHTFVKGYDQAVREIQGHFAKAGEHGISAIIAEIFGKDRPA